MPAFKTKIVCIRETTSLISVYFFPQVRDDRDKILAIRAVYVGLRFSMISEEETSTWFVRVKAEDWARWQFRVALYIAADVGVATAGDARRSRRRRWRSRQAIVLSINFFNALGQSMFYRRIEISADEMAAIVGESTYKDVCELTKIQRSVETTAVAAVTVVAAVYASSSRQCVCEISLQYTTILLLRTLFVLMMRHAHAFT